MAFECEDETVFYWKIPSISQYCIGTWRLLMHKPRWIRKFNGLIHCNHIACVWVFLRWSRHLRVFIYISAIFNEFSIYSLLFFLHLKKTRFYRIKMVKPGRTDLKKGYLIFAFVLVKWQLDYYWKVFEPFEPSSVKDKYFPSVKLKYTLCRRKKNIECRKLCIIITIKSRFYCFKLVSVLDGIY